MISTCPLYLKGRHLSQKVSSFLKGEFLYQRMVLIDRIRSALMRKLSFKDRYPFFTSMPLNTNLNPLISTIPEIIMSILYWRLLICIKIEINSLHTDITILITGSAASRSLT